MRNPKNEVSLYFLKPLRIRKKNCFSVRRSGERSGGLCVVQSCIEKVLKIFGGVEWVANFAGGMEGKEV
jgi:hypothetical protein